MNILATDNIIILVDKFLSQKKKNQTENEKLGSLKSCRKRPPIRYLRKHAIRLCIRTAMRIPRAPAY
jgi:hypothetical protein